MIRTLYAALESALRALAWLPYIEAKFLTGLADTCAEKAKEAGHV